jgi:hypothetical protein
LFFLFIDGINTTIDVGCFSAIACTLLANITCDSLDGGVKITVTCFSDNIPTPIIFELLAAAGSREFASKLVWKLQAHILVKSAFAAWIRLVTAAFNLCILTEIGAIILKANATCIFQVAAFARLVVADATRFSLQGAGATKF